MVQFMRGQNVVKIAKVYDDINGVKALVAKRGIGLTQESFNVGEAQFVVDDTLIATRENWNHWGGNKPVLEFDLRDGKPMIRREKVSPKNKDGKRPPTEVSFIRQPKPSSASTNLIFRRGGLKAMMAATKNVSMDPRIAGIVGAIAGAGIIYLLVSLTGHPPTCIPQAGFYCKLTEIPANVTVVGGK